MQNQSEEGKKNSTPVLRRKQEGAQKQGEKKRGEKKRKRPPQRVDEELPFDPFFIFYFIFKELPFDPFRLCISCGGG